MCDITDYICMCVCAYNPYSRQMWALAFDSRCHTRTKTRTLLTCTCICTIFTFILAVLCVPHHWSHSLVLAHTRSHTCSRCTTCFLPFALHATRLTWNVTLAFKVIFPLKPGPYQLALVVHICSRCIACATSPIAFACACAHPFLHSFSLYHLPPPICVTCNTRQCLLTRNDELHHILRCSRHSFNIYPLYSRHNTNTIIITRPICNHYRSGFLASMSWGDLDRAIVGAW